MEEQLAKPISEQVAPPEGHPATQPLDVQHKIKVRLGLVGFALFLIFVIGLFWLATTPEQTVGLTLSFVSGLSMIFLPCTLPLAFVIVSMTLGKDPKKGFLMAIFFGLGLTITLSFYGVFIAALGKTFGLKSDVEVYAVLLGGAVAFIFGLSEIGLHNFKLPSYTGKFPDFIQRQKDYVKTFMLGLFLGNAGVGCPNPAFYVLLGYIATTGDLFNGWFLGFVHGLGRAVPIIFLAILGTLGVNALGGVMRHKEAVERAMGWALVIIGAYLLTFGIFGHDWFIASGIHGAWEQVVSNVGGERFGEVILKHEHKLVDIPNFIQYGNKFFLGLLALTMLTVFIIKRPSRRTMLSLSVIYFIIALIIGYSTGWTYKTGTNIHIQFRGTAAPKAGGAPEGDGQAHVIHVMPELHEEGSVAEGLVVNLNYSPLPASVDEPIKVDFFVNEKPGNKPVTDLEIEHTKFMHIIGVRDDLEEFFHVHPEVSADMEGVWSIEHQFASPGLYKLWSEVKRGGMTHAFGHPEISVKGEAPETSEEAKMFAKNLIVGNDELGNYQIALSYDEPITAGREMDLVFSVSTATGGIAELEPFLGEDMHLAIIRDDLKTFIHTHPEAGNHHDQAAALIPIVYAHGEEEEPHEESEHKKISFHVTFTEPGIYRAFAQFRPSGIELPPDESLVAGFWISVEEGKEAPSAAVSKSAQWWGLLVVSLVLMTLLGLGVKKYLAVKAPAKKEVEPKVETPQKDTARPQEQEPKVETPPEVTGGDSAEQKPEEPK